MYHVFSAQNAYATETFSWNSDTALLKNNRLLNERISIIEYFQDHCQLLKFTIRDMFFKAKLASLINSQVLTETVLRQKPGGRLNKKDGLTRYGDSHVKDKTS